MAHPSQSISKFMETERMAPQETDLGEKRVCISCNTLFYDFNTEQPACPACGTVASLGKENPVPVPKEEVAVATDSEETGEENFDDGETEDTETLSAVKPAADPAQDEATEEE